MAGRLLCTGCPAPRWGRREERLRRGWSPPTHAAPFLRRRTLKPGWHGQSLAVEYRYAGRSTEDKCHAQSQAITAAAFPGRRRGPCLGQAFHRHRPPDAEPVATSGAARSAAAKPAAAGQGAEASPEAQGVGADHGTTARAAPIRGGQHPRPFRHPAPEARAVSVTCRRAVRLVASSEPAPCAAEPRRRSSRRRQPPAACLSTVAAAGSARSALPSHPRRPWTVCR